MKLSCYGLLHFLVDMVCAWAMFAFFREGRYENLLIYNFCAFALQLPLGTLLDLLRNKMQRIPAVCAAAGTFLTVLGAVLHPALLGLGNALFHVGGGIDVIEEDFAKNRKGSALGIFVAPGAVGLYLGTIFGKQTGNLRVLLVAAVLMLVLLFILWRGRSYVQPIRTPQRLDLKTITIAFCCFVVVVLRSWVGLSVSFPWESLTVYGALAVLASASGKLSGGLLAARYGIDKVSAVSLMLSAGCYLLSDMPALGLLAMFLFNMSMPLTLYLLIAKLPNLPGFSFGLLTFGLFLGFLPVYTGIKLPISDAAFGAVGSILSLVLLIAAGRAAKHGKISA